MKIGRLQPGDREEEQTRVLGAVRTVLTIEAPSPDRQVKTGDTGSFLHRVVINLQNKSYSFCQVKYGFSLSAQTLLSDHPGIFIKALMFTDDENLLMVMAGL